ncbi:DapH/DapD/GlmU-related protein [Mesorhizobium loti]|nr:DapH/DapD/GlmU-related protein [Mesorhizobium loti]
MIHPLAHIDASIVEIGEGTKIWQFASVIRGARIGKDCIIGASAQIDGASIGNDCHIQNGVSIPHGVDIGDSVFVGPGAVFCNDMWPDATKDGIDHEVIAAGCTIRVEDGASIGANATILPGVIIGAGAFVAAGAVVTKNVPPNMVWRRNGWTGAFPDGYRSRRMRLCK